MLRKEIIASYGTELIIIIIETALSFSFLAYHLTLLATGQQNFTFQASSPTFVIFYFFF